MTHFVKWNEFDPSRLIGGPIESGESQPKPDPNDPNKTITIKYQHSKPEYEYDVVNAKTGETTKCIAPLIFQLPPVTSSRGLTTKIGMGGYEGTSILCKFDMSKPDIRAAFSMGENIHGVPDGMWKKFHMWCSQYLWENRSNIPIIKQLNSKEMVPAIFPFPINFKTDENGIVASKDPTCFFKIPSFGKIGTSEHKGASFTAPIIVGNVAGKSVYKKIDWSQMRDVKMTFVPMIGLKRIYIGSKASLQLYLKSAVVTSIEPSSNDEILDGILDEYSKDSNIVSTLSSQLDALTSRLTNANPPSPTESTEPKDEPKEEVSATLPISEALAPTTSVPETTPLPTSFTPAPLPVVSPPKPVVKSTSITALLAGGPINSA